MKNYAYGTLKKYGTSVGRMLDPSPTVRSTTGVKGVYYLTGSQKYLTQIVLRGKTYSLGTFDDLEKATKARKEAEEILYGPLIESIRQNGDLCVDPTDDQIAEFEKFKSRLVAERAKAKRDLLVKPKVRFKKGTIFICDKQPFMVVGDTFDYPFYAVNLMNGDLITVEEDTEIKIVWKNK